MCSSNERRGLSTHTVRLCSLNQMRDFLGFDRSEENNKLEASLRIANKISPKTDLYKMFMWWNCSLSSFSPLMFTSRRQPGGIQTPDCFPDNKSSAKWELFPFHAHKLLFWFGGNWCNKIQSTKPVVFSECCLRELKACSYHADACYPIFLLVSVAMATSNL